MTVLRMKTKTIFRVAHADDRIVLQLPLLECLLTCTTECRPIGVFTRICFENPTRTTITFHLTTFSNAFPDTIAIHIRSYMLHEQCQH